MMRWLAKLGPTERIYGERMRALLSGMAVSGRMLLRSGAQAGGSIAAWILAFALPTLALFCAGLEPGARADAPGALFQTGHRIPFRFNPPLSPYIVVQAQINGQGPTLPFLVDTGWPSALTLDYRVAQRISLKSLLLAGATKRDAFRYTLSALTGPANRIDMTVIRRGTTIPSLAGVIGLPLFSSLTTQFDFDRKQLTLTEKRHPPLHLVGGTNLTLYPGRHSFYVAATSPMGDWTPLLLDLGSHETVAPFAFGVGRRPPVMRTTTYNEVDSFGITCRRLIRSFRVGSIQIDRLAVATALDAEDQLLGNDFLRRFQVILDGPNRILTLKRRSGYARLSRQIGWTGAVIDAKGAQLIISFVTPRSPAGRAGIRSGDALLSVDGILVRGLDVQPVRRLLAGQEGTKARVQLSRNGRLLTPVLLARGSEFDAPAAAVDGLTLKKQIGWLPDAGKEQADIEVAVVQPGCSADRAGIRKGDHILALNDVPANRIVSVVDLKTGLFGPKIVLRLAGKAGRPKRKVVLKALSGR